MNTGSKPFYRRGAAPPLQVPVVLPQIDVTVDEHGRLDVRLDREPYSADTNLGRADLRRVVEDIARHVGTPVRVDVREADGSVFSDFVSPPAPDAAPAAVAAPSVAAPVGRVCGAGFVPGERVVVAVVVAEVVADGTGTARLRLPPALLSSHGDQLIVVSADTATPADAGAA